MSVERYTVKGMPKTIWLNLGDDDSDEYRLASDYAALEAERDKWKARAEAAEKLAIGSIRFMEEDFPEAPEELDRACVSGPYLDHYKALLAMAHLIQADGK